MSEELKERIRIAMADKDTAEELIKLIEDLQAKVAALEEAAQEP